MDHQSEIASVHNLINDDSRGNKEDVEHEHPNCFEEASEEAEE
jgi:hypothetical protein